MSVSNLDRVIEEVKAMTSDEQHQLFEWLNGLLTTPTPPMTEEEFDQYLIAKGVMTSAPPPITDLTPFQNRQLIEVKGKPLSDTVIEERR